MKKGFILQDSILVIFIVTIISVIVLQVSTVTYNTHRIENDIFNTNNEEYLTSLTNLCQCIVEEKNTEEMDISS